MVTLELQLENQLLTLLNQEIIASGDANIDKCVFSFSKEWDGFVRTAVFYQDKNNVQYAVLSGDDTCVIPAVAMARAGRMHIGVFGIKDTAILTSTLVTIDIHEGAVSSENISVEPTDDVFLAIIAQYQRIVELMSQYEKTAEQFNIQMAEQNAILETLNAFDVVEVKKQLDMIEDRMINNTILAEEIMSREVIIRDVPIKFVNKVCRIENELITENSLCDVYFDEYSYEMASTVLILPVSYNGYLELISSVDIVDELMANILVRRE